jgi:thymidine phosphorylase
VGFTAMAAIGQRVEAGDVLATVHAASAADAELACKQLARAIHVGVHEPPAAPIMIKRIQAHAA